MSVVLTFYCCEWQKLVFPWAVWSELKVVNGREWFSTCHRDWFSHKWYEESWMLWTMTGSCKVSRMLWMAGSGFSTCRTTCSIRCTVCSSTPIITTTACRLTRRHRSTLTISCTSSSLADSSLWYVFISYTHCTATYKHSGTGCGGIYSYCTATGRHSCAGCVGICLVSYCTSVAQYHRFCDMVSTAEKYLGTR